MRQFVNESISYLVPSFYKVRGLLTLNHLKNNQKIFVEIFGQFKKLLYFCTRFREGSRFIKIDKIFFQKSFGSSEKSCNFAPAFKKGVKFKKRLKKFLKKDLVN